MDLIMHEFRELGTTRDRQMTMVGTSVGPIPSDKLDVHLDRMGLDGEAREWMRAAIRALDNEYLNFEHKRLSDEAKRVEDEMKRGRGMRTPRTHRGRK